MDVLRYAMVVRGDEQSARLEREFHQLAAARSFEHVSDGKLANLIVSIGGDGTMLQAFHRFVDELDHISFVGIHTGHLGFYADWKPTELTQLADAIAAAKSNWEKSIVKYPLVDVRVESNSGMSHLLAMNEFTIKTQEGSLVADLMINDHLFENFRGDGICISTPSGSTAYNKSVGGAVIHPSFEGIQLAGIAALNNRVYRSLGSPIVLPKHHHCDVIPKTGKYLVITCDHLTMHFENVRSIRCMVATQKVYFNRFRAFPFWNRVRDAFIGTVSES